MVDNRLFLNQNTDEKQTQQTQAHWYLFNCEKSKVVIFFSQSNYSKIT